MKSLIQLRERYIEKSAWLVANAPADHRAEYLASSNYYAQAAQAVDRLIVPTNSQTVTE